MLQYVERPSTNNQAENVELLAQTSGFTKVPQNITKGYPPVSSSVASWKISEVKKGFYGKNIEHHRTMRNFPANHV
jgi:hypothetical protein